MKICMVGAGYVGLVSGACFADFGHEVTCVDLDPTKIARLGEGIMPIFEPGLEDLVRKNVAAARLAFTTDLASGVAGAGAVFIAVGSSAWASRGTRFASRAFLSRLRSWTRPH